MLYPNAGFFSFCTNSCLCAYLLTYWFLGNYGGTCHSAQYHTRRFSLIDRWKCFPLMFNKLCEQILVRVHYVQVWTREGGIQKEREHLSCGEYPAITCYIKTNPVTIDATKWYYPVNMGINGLQDWIVKDRPADTIWHICACFHSISAVLGDKAASYPRFWSVINSIDLFFYAFQ